MAARHKLDLTGDLRSDAAPINGLIRAALAAGGEGLVTLKDPTRFGRRLLVEIEGEPLPRIC